MSVIALPTSGLQVHQFGFGQQDYSLTFANPDTGAQQSRILAPARWTCTMTLNLSVGQSQAALWRTMIMQLRGKTNQLAVYDIKNPAPAGTARGTMILNSGTGALAVGGTTLIIAGATASGTLKQGDWLGVGSGATRQLFSVQADAVADGSGNITVTVEPPSRYAQLAGASVTWDKPTCLMRRVDSGVSWSANSWAEGNISLNLIESWE